MNKPYSIRAKFRGDIAIISLRGKFSYEQGTLDFRKKILFLKKRGYRTFLIHFCGRRGVISIDSSFIGELHHFTQEIGAIPGGRFYLVNLKRSIQRSLKINKVIDKLDIAVDDPTMGRS